MSDAENHPTATPPIETQNSERRAFERMSWLTSVQVSWRDGASFLDPTTVMACDISFGGMSLIVDDLIEPGTMGVMVHRCANGDCQIRCFEVLHCHADADKGKFVVGGRIVKMPPDMEVTVAFDAHMPWMQKPVCRAAAA